MGHRFPVHAGAFRQALIAVLLAGSAFAAPKKIEARVEFDRGVAAYKKGDFEAAAEALASSFSLENDEETLFAWAQTERKAGHCDKAIELYTKLLSFKLPAANKQAVKVQISECQAIVAEQKSKPPPEPVAPPPREDKPAPAPSYTWWKDPIGDGLVGGGAVSIGLGVVFLVQGHSDDQAKAKAASYAEFTATADRAESRGRVGVIATVAGAALVGGGLFWYASHGKAREHAVTGWLARGAGGVALGGRF